MKKNINPKIHNCCFPQFTQAFWARRFRVRPCSRFGHETNAFSISSPQLPPQNSILPSRWALNYSMLQTHQCSVENFKLDPWWVTGFVVPPPPPDRGGGEGDLRGPTGDPPLDSEGCFHLSITQRKDRKHGLQVRPHFKINLNVKDQTVLVAIKNSLRVGQKYKFGLNSVQLQVLSIK